MKGQPVLPVGFNIEIGNQLTIAGKDEAPDLALVPVSRNETLTTTLSARVHPHPITPSSPGVIRDLHGIRVSLTRRAASSNIVDTLDFRQIVYRVELPLGDVKSAVQGASVSSGLVRLQNVAPPAPPPPPDCPPESTSGFHEGFDRAPCPAGGCYTVSHSGSMVSTGPMCPVTTEVWINCFAPYVELYDWADTTTLCWSFEPRLDGTCPTVGEPVPWAVYFQFSWTKSYQATQKDPICHGQRTTVSTDTLSVIYDPPEGGPGTGLWNVVTASGGLPNKAHKCSFTVHQGPGSDLAYPIEFRATPGHLKQPVLYIGKYTLRSGDPTVYVSHTVEGTFVSGDMPGDATIHAGSSDPIYIESVLGEMTITPTTKAPHCPTSADPMGFVVKRFYEEIVYDEEDEDDEDQDDEEYRKKAIPGHVIQVSASSIEPATSTVTVQPPEGTSGDQVDPGTSHTATVQGVTSFALRVTDKSVFEGPNLNFVVQTTEFLANGPPMVQIETPSEGAKRCSTTEPVDFLGSVTDPDQPLSDLDITWTISSLLPNVEPVIVKNTLQFTRALGPGPYSIKLAVNDGCSNITETRILGVNQPPRILQPQDGAAVCMTTTGVSFQGEVDQPPNGPSSLNVTWKIQRLDDPNAQPIEKSGVLSFTEPLAAGRYQVTLQVIDPSGCESPPAVHSFRVTKPVAVIDVARGEYSEEGGSLTLDGTKSELQGGDQGGSPLSFQWTIPGWTPPDPALLTQSKLDLILPIGRYKVALKVSSSPDCSATVEGIVVVSGQPLKETCGIKATTCTKERDNPLPDPEEGTRLAICSPCGCTLGSASSETGGHSAPVVSDPVVLSSGDLMEAFNDIAWPVLDGMMVFQRTYISSRTRTGQLGIGWSHTFEEYLEDRGTQGVVITDAQGFELVFPKNSSGGWNPPSTGGATIQHEPNETWVVRYRTGAVARYRSDGKLLSYSDGNGNTFTLGYSPSGDLVSVEDPFGGRLEIEVSGGLIRSLTNKAGHKCLFTYTPDRRLATTTDVRGVTTAYAYHPVTGMLTRIQHPTGDRTDFGYDVETQQVTEIRQTASDGRATVERIEYPTAQTRRYIDAMGHVTEYELSKGGRLLKKTDPDGAHITLVRDRVGRVTSQVKSDGTTQAWAYGADGQLDAYQSASGKISRVERDPATGVITAVVHPDGTRELRQYDGALNLISTTDQLGRRTTYTRNSRGQVETVTDPAQRVTRYEYSNDGYVSATIDPMGRRT
ncbi:MAG: DUF6531 domain-containing protein, partial [Thermodesulfobacteriota bacterium]